MQVASVDFPQKKIYLHQDTVTQGFDAMAAHFEILAIVQQNATNGQNFREPMRAEGNIQKDLAGTRFTPRFVVLAAGWEWIPYDNGAGNDYALTSSVEILSDDGRSDRETFNRDGLLSKVDIDPIYQQVEVIRVTTGGSADPQVIRDALAKALSEGVSIEDGSIDWLLNIIKVLASDAADG